MIVSENADTAKIASICLPLRSYGLLRNAPRPTHAEKGAAVGLVLDKSNIKCVYAVRCF
jgi:hypothetical protein